MPGTELHVPSNAVKDNITHRFRCPLRALPFAARLPPGTLPAASRSLSVSARHPPPIAACDPPQLSPTATRYPPHAHASRNSHHSHARTFCMSCRPPRVHAARKTHCCSSSAAHARCTERASSRPAAVSDPTSTRHLRHTEHPRAVCIPSLVLPRTVRGISVHTHHRL